MTGLFRCFSNLAVAVVAIVLSILGACSSDQKPQSGNECVTSFDCPLGLVCDNGYCVESVTDAVPAEGDVVVEGEHPILPDTGFDAAEPDSITDDHGVSLDDNGAILDEDTGETDEAEEASDDTVDVFDDAGEVGDDAPFVTDDTGGEETDEGSVVFDDAPVMSDDGEEPDDVVPVDIDQPIVPDQDIVADTTPPTVVETMPLDQASNVLPTTNIVIVFSESLLPASVVAEAFSVMEGGSTPIAVAFSFNGKETVTLDPVAELALGMTYTVTIAETVADLAGNPLGTPYEFSFTITTCGNGTVEGTEVCDDGTLNGTYGHCNLFCMGLGSHCGDGITDAGYELCDTADTIICNQIPGRGYANTVLVPCNATCDWWVTTNCTCATGYAKDANEFCVDIDECVVNDNPCDVFDSGATCTNTPGAYTCTCSNGFQFLGGYCRDINECLSYNEPCDDYGDAEAWCSNLMPGYVCNCSSGFESRDGSCRDIDDCVGNPCDNGGDLNASCINQLGGYDCSCSSGYEDNGVTCVEIDECIGNHCNDNGDTGATCTDGIATYTCSCSVGFEFSSGSCRDVDECVLQSNPCDDQGDTAAQCANAVGSYSCSCSGGFAPGAGTCQDVNECLVGNGGCDPLTECTNTVGGRTCGPCPSGYTGDGETGCIDIDECVTQNNPCNDQGDTGATCTNTPGGYTCNCSGGWYDNGTTCVEVDDCYGNPCDNGGDNSAVCTDIGAAYACACSGGFQFSGGTCSDINECTSANPCDDQGDTGAVCTNNVGSYTCTCSSGFTVGSGTCLDIDECMTQNNPCNDNGDTSATCTNTPGSYTCGCSSGFQFTNGSCFDINECLMNNGGCDPLTTCTNTIGGRTCGPCPSGYTGDGYSGCVDINECVTQDNPCNDHSDTTATCTNTPGSYTCTCSSGFRFTNGSCWDIDECAENLDNCHPTLATCTNTVPGFTCACIPPAVGDGVTCSTCGDGHVDPGEVCDDGVNNGSYGYCNSTCTGLGPRCGDGITNGPEQCDDGNSSNNDYCKSDCTNNVCGDGYQNTSAVAFTETFEGGKPSYMSGDWGTSTTYKHGGTYALKSAVISDDGYTFIYFTRTIVGGSFCFWYYGESESGYDYLYLYVDGGAAWSTSGDHRTWTQQCVSVSNGPHTIEFMYSKDSSGSTGLDAYWIDDLLMPYYAEECESGQTTSCTNLGEECGTASCGGSCTWSTANCYDEDQWGSC